MPSFCNHFLCRASLYEKVLPPCIADAVLSHPTMHLAVMVTQILPHHASLPPWQLRAMFWYYLVSAD